MDDPTNGELSLMIKDLSREVRDGMTRIEAQTTRTNGRVTKLEAAKNMAIGGLILTNALILPILFTILARATK